MKTPCRLCHLDVDVTNPHRYVDDCVAALDEHLADEDSLREHSEEKDLDPRWNASPAPKKRTRRSSRKT